MLCFQEVCVWEFSHSEGNFRQLLSKSQAITLKKLLADIISDSQNQSQKRRLIISTLLFMYLPLRIIYDKLFWIKNSFTQISFFKIYPMLNSLNATKLVPLVPCTYTASLCLYSLYCYLISLHEIFMAPAVRTPCKHVQHVLIIDKIGDFVGTIHVSAQQ